MGSRGDSPLQGFGDRVPMSWPQALAAQKIKNLTPATESQHRGKDSWRGVRFSYERSELFSSAIDACAKRRLLRKRGRRKTIAPFGRGASGDSEHGQARHAYHVTRAFIFNLLRCRFFPLGGYAPPTLRAAPLAAATRRTAQEASCALVV